MLDFGIEKLPTKRGTMPERRGARLVDTTWIDIGTVPTCRRNSVRSTVDKRTDIWSLGVVL